MDRLTGTMETLSSMQLTADMEGLDAQSKTVLHSREVLAVILQGVITEYKGYSRKEIMDFIDPDSMTDEKEISSGRSNTQIRGDNSEFVQLNEKVSHFDMVFRAKNPQLSTEDVQISLHVDVEPQKTYRPGYPIEMRGIYYLARLLSSQLSLVTKDTDYSELEKCYGIWICRDDIPKSDRYSVSVYEIKNTKNTGMQTVEKRTYDLLTLIIIRLGSKEYEGKEGEEDYELLHFLNAIMYPHKEDFMDTVSEYIDFSENEELWKEVKHMGGLGESIREECLEEGIVKGREEGREEGRLEGIAEGRLEGIAEGRAEGKIVGIQALIQDNVEEQVPRERILLKLQKHFGLEEEKAEEYYERFALLSK